MPDAQRPGSFLVLAAQPKKQATVFVTLVGYLYFLLYKILITDENTGIKSSYLI